MNEITKEWMEKHYGIIDIEQMPFSKSLIRPYKDKIEELERKIARMKQEIEEITESSSYWFNQFKKLETSVETKNNV
jgi:chromosome segregation ATPase